MKIEKKVSFGNIVSLLGMLGAFFVAWGSLSSRVEFLEDRLNEHERGLMPVMQELRLEVSELKVEQAKIGNDVEWIKTKIHATQ